MTTSNAAAFTFKSLLSLLLFMESRRPSAKTQVGLPCPDPSVVGSSPSLPAF